MLGGCVDVINVVTTTKGIILVYDVTIDIANNTRRWLVNTIITKILIKTPIRLLLLLL